MLAAIEACPHATHGDTPRCLKALSEAERALGRSNPAEDPGWVDLDEGGWPATSRGPCGTSPGPSEAERFATRSIEVCHPQHRRTRMQRYAILATTHVQQGDLEGACAVGRQVLEEARGPNSTRTLDDVTRLVQLVSASIPARRRWSSPSRLVRYSSLAVGHHLLVDRDHLERLRQVARWQPSCLTVRGQPLTHVVLERVPMGRVTLVGTKLGEPPVERVGDVDIVEHRV